MKNDSDGFSVM